MKTRRRSFMVLSALYSMLGMWWIWKPAFLSPQSYLFGPGGDGIKNYYTPLYHILYDKGYWFTGLNYPYGEHVAYTDAQPILSQLLQWLINGNTEYAFNIIALLNLLMLISIPLAAMYIYRILALWEVPNGFAALIAASIALLSPQVERWTGHFGLGYACFFPMMWYYQASWNAKGNWLDLFRLILTLIVFGGLHTYYLALGAAWILPSSIFIWVVKNKKKWLLSVMTIFSAILPLLLYSWWINATGGNDLSDRHPHPYGFQAYVSGWRMILFPENGAWIDIVQKFIPLPNAVWEGMAYIGIPAILSWILGILFLHSWKRLSGGWPPYFGVYFLAGTMVFLVSTGLPFLLIPEQWLPIQIFQFRALGRFAWPAFYVLSLGAAFLMYRLSESIRMKGQAVMAMGGIILFSFAWYGEGMILQKKKADFVLKEGKNADDFLSLKRNYKKWLTDEGYQPNDFQAIVVLPYFSIGSEELYIENGYSLYHACKASLALHLPIMQTYLGRTSLHQAFSIAQLMSHPLISKPILDNLPSDKPLLVIVTPDSLNENEKIWIQSAKLIVKQDDISLYELKPSDIKAQKVNFLNKVMNEKWKYKMVNTESDTIYTNNKGFYYFKDFQLVKQKNGSFTIWSGRRNYNRIPNEIEISIWLDTYQENSAYPILNVQTWDIQKNLLKTQEFNPKTSLDIFGKTIRLSADIQLDNATDSIKISLNGKEIAPGTFLMREKNINTKIISKTGVFWNNYPIQ